MTIVQTLPKKSSGVQTFRGSLIEKHQSELIQRPIHPARIRCKTFSFPTFGLSVSRFGEVIPASADVLIWGLDKHPPQTVQYGQLAIGESGSSLFLVVGHTVRKTGTVPAEFMGHVNNRYPSNIHSRQAVNIMPRSCSTCGKQVGANARFCGYCGAPMGGGAPVKQAIETLHRPILPFNEQIMCRWDAWQFRLVSFGLAMGMLAVCWRLQASLIVLALVLPPSAGLLAHTFQHPWLADRLRDIYLWMSDVEKGLKDAARWPFIYSAFFWPLHKVWDSSARWQSGGFRLGMRIAAVTVYAEIFLGVLLAFAFMAFLAILVVVGLFLAVLLAALALDAGTKAIEDILSTKTDYRIDPESGRIEKRDFLTWSSTGYRIDPDSGEIRKDACVLTSACVRFRGLPDDCQQLRELRQFRDNYLIHRPDGESLLQEYYMKAPALVQRIEQSSRAEEIYERVYCRLIVPCLEHIRVKEYAEALDIYRKEFAALCEEMERTAPPCA